MEFVAWCLFGVYESKIGRSHYRERPFFMLAFRADAIYLVVFRLLLHQLI